MPANLKDRLRKLILLQTGQKFWSQIDLGQCLPQLLHEKVVKLDLSEQNFTHIGCLRLAPYLRKLDLKKTLWQSDISTKEFASVLMDLPHMEVLYLHYNEKAVDDEILRVIGKNCLKLRELDLGRCSGIRLCILIWFLKSCFF